MIKINVITIKTNWFQYIKNPNHYIDRKLRKFNTKNQEFKRNNLYCTLLLSGDKEIKQLNKKFRKKNKSTDELSFTYHKKKELKKRIKSNKEIYLGDIIININKIKSKNVLKNFKEEFDHLWIHGLVHLLGHDHKKDKDFIKMNKIEKRFINLINV